jgi:hypothetical protein
MNSIFNLKNPFNNPNFHNLNLLALISDMKLDIN